MKKIFRIRSQKIRGFSLVEVLTAVTIGGIILSVVMISFVTFHRTSVRLDRMRQLQRETNFTLNRIIDRVRQHSIDYGAYAEKNLDPGGTDQLFIGNDQGAFVFVPATADAVRTETLLFRDQPLFSKNFRVKDAFFTITPDVDPLQNIAASAAQRQPRVQIELEVESILDPAVRLAVRTTVSSRQYQ